LAEFISTLYRILHKTGFGFNVKVLMTTVLFKKTKPTDNPQTNSSLSSLILNMMFTSDKQRKYTNDVFFARLK